MNPYLDPRDGLAAFHRKLADGPVTVGYLGGSLTMMKEGWRPLFHQWLVGTFPRSSPHRSLHFGRGGVGSASGVFFVHDEIIEHAPDLVFVEYAINDSYDFLTPPALRRESIEGIVRAIKSRHPTCDVFFLYMHHILRGDAIAEVIATYEAVADHYGIPSLNVGRRLVDRVDTGPWSFLGEDGRPALLRDECHPLPHGNRLIAEWIAEALIACRIEGNGRPPGLPAPLSTHPFVGGRVLQVDESMVVGTCETRQGRVGNIGVPVAWLSLTAGSRLSFRLPGALAGLYVVVGPQSGIVRARIGGRRVERNLFDRWCSYERISTCILIETPADARAAESEVELELSPEPPDYSVCPKLEHPPGRRTLDVVGLFVLGGPETNGLPSETRTVG